MRKIIIVMICLVMCGCPAKESEDSDLIVSDNLSITFEFSNNSTDIETSEISSESEIESELNHDEIMAGDFSSIAGEYVNPEGKTIFLEENIKERMIDDEIHYTGEYYFLNVKIEDGLYGIGLAIYDVGVEVPNLEGLTDLTKIRIRYFQAEPMSVEEVYTKK